MSHLQGQGPEHDTSTNPARLPRHWWDRLFLEQQDHVMRHLLLKAGCAWQ